MPWALERRHGARQLHFVTFSCWRRQPLLEPEEAKGTFEAVLEETRRRYRFLLYGYVIMPEHVHLLLGEPEKGQLATALQAVKQGVAQRLLRGQAHFWETRYYDFNVWSAKKRVEKLRYMHRNPVKRGLVERPEDWEWGSFRHYRDGVMGVVEIESEWTEIRRKQAVASNQP